MKTKHLFYTMALAGMFAACTNEEFVNGEPQNAATAERPTVGGVTIDLNEPSTRLVLGENMNWIWEEGDKIAAMLMDQNNTGVRYGSATLTDDWNELTWLERYHLVDYVHTNYPFNYKGGKWETDANMLEGNYFLVYPYMSFNGQRQAYFDISKQKQVGNSKDARKKAYAANQHFIGYARLDATAGNTKLNAKMSEILAPVRINIQSNCTEVSGEPLYVEKIVLAHPSFHSQYTIDPTTAAYPAENVEGTDVVANAWNLNPDAVRANLNEDQNPTEHNNVKEHFNYANYVSATGVENYEKDLYNHLNDGSVLLADYVYNIKDGSVGDINTKWDEKPENNGREAHKYYYDEAIRKVVKPLWKENWSENTTDYVEVYTYAENGTDPMELKSGYEKKLSVIAMVPEFNDINSTEEGLQLYIYTNKGLVGPVDMSEKHAGAGSDVQTSDALLAASPRMDMQTVTVIIDDPDIVRVPDNKVINNTDDLKKFVEYLTKNSTDSRIDITLTNDVTIDDELAAAIKEMKKDKGVDNVALYFQAPANSKKYNVNIATTADNADILESLDLDDNILVEVVDKAVVDLTSAAHNYKSYKKGQSMLNILVDKGGTLNITEVNNSSVGGWETTNIDKDDAFVVLENNGTVNVDTEVEYHTGIRLINNKGVFNVKSNANIQLMKQTVKDENGQVTEELLSENKLNGTINVEAGAVLSGTLNGNIKNYGTIEVKGTIYGVENCLAENSDWHVLPGRIVCEASAQVSLTSNKGKVIYKNLPAKIELLDGNKTTGVFEYTMTSSGKVSDLTKKFVTDVFVENATLTVDDDESSFRYVELGNNAKLKESRDKNNKIVNDVLNFAAVATGTVKNAAWNNSNTEMFKNEGIVPDVNDRGMNQLVTKGHATITYLTINLNNVDDDAKGNGKRGTRDVVIFNDAKGKGKELTLTKVKINYSTASSTDLTKLANAKLNNVAIIVNNVTQLGLLYTPKHKEVNSNIEIQVDASLKATNGDESRISINKPLS